jgi:tetratricopeptide (TPR) repeat protein
MGKNPHLTSNTVNASRSSSVLLAVLAACSPESGKRQQQHGGHPLGIVDFPVSCTKQAQAEFNRAVALLHHMTYPQAREAFAQVATTDPKCAMAHWGIAMTLFQPLWPTRPNLEARRLGWQEAEKARNLEPSTERERMFIATTEAFFREPDSTDYWLRIRRWEQAAEKVHTAFKDDPEASAFYALAHLATTPSDTISRAHADRAAEMLLGILQKNPDHPGGMHYLVHANDVPGRERESLEIMRKYEGAAPDNPHALHMPTHIYTRIGDWNKVIDGNLRAAEAALRYPAGERGEFVWDEFPHAIEYLIYAYLQKGADEDAARQLRRLHTTDRLEPTLKTAFHITSTRARYALERHEWKEAAQIIPREPAELEWDRFPWPEAIAQFARGMGAVHLKDLAQAEKAEKRLGELESATQKARETLFARNVQVLHLELQAWIANERGHADKSLALMQDALKIETSTPKPPVTPGPTLPAYELLGDLLMEQKRPVDALAAYKQSLERQPQRFNSLLGAARAASALGDSTQARAMYKELLDVANGGKREVPMKEARAYLGSR